MEDKELKNQFEQEEKDFEEIGIIVKNILLDKHQKDFKIAWTAKTDNPDINVLRIKNDFENKLYSLMKEYGIFVIKARRINDQSVK